MVFHDQEVIKKKYFVYFVILKFIISRFNVVRSPKLRLSGSEELNHQTTEHWEKNQLLDVFGRIPKHIRVLELSTGSMNASKTRQCKD